MALTRHNCSSARRETALRSEFRFSRPTFRELTQWTFGGKFAFISIHQDERDNTRWGLEECVCEEDLLVALIQVRANVSRSAIQGLSMNTRCKMDRRRKAKG